MLWLFQLERASGGVGVRIGGLRVGKPLLGERCRLGVGTRRCDGQEGVRVVLRLVRCTLWVARFRILVAELGTGRCGLGGRPPQPERLAVRWLGWPRQRSDGSWPASHQPV